MASIRRAPTLRLPEKKLRVIRAIAGYENRTLDNLYEELTDEYIERRKGTAEILKISGFLDDVREGSREVRARGGKDLSKLGR
jgi:hypothetical protein